MQFFVIGKNYDDPHQLRRLAEWDESVDWEQITCPIDKDHMRAGKRTTPLSIVMPNLDLQDFVWTWLNDCLLTERAKRCFEEAGLTGYRLDPVRIARVKRRKDDRPIPELWELVPTSSAKIDATAVGLRIKERCPACGLVEEVQSKHGAPIDESTWDGSDIFDLGGGGGPFVTPRVIDCVVENNLAGASFLPAEELPCPESMIEP
jgi:hypothetical protein